MDFVLKLEHVPQLGKNPAVMLDLIVKWTEKDHVANLELIPEYFVGIVEPVVMDMAVFPSANKTRR